MLTSTGPDATQYIIGHAELKTVLCSGDNLPKLLSSESSLQNIVSFDPIPPEAYKEAEKYGVRLWNFEEVLKEGEKNPREHIEADPQDLFMIMYTSGTTGVPKGVMISNANMVASLTAIEMYSTCS